MPEYFCNCFNIRCTIDTNEIDDAQKLPEHEGPFVLEANGIQIAQDKLCLINTKNEFQTVHKTWKCINCDLECVQQRDDGKVYLNQRMEKRDEINFIGSVYGYIPSRNTLKALNNQVIRAIIEDLSTRLDGFIRSEKLVNEQKVAKYKYELEMELNKKELMLTRLFEQISTLAENNVDVNDLISGGNESIATPKPDILDNISSPLDLMDEFDVTDTSKENEEPLESDDDLVTRRDEIEKPLLFGTSLPIEIPLSAKMTQTSEEREDGKFIAPHILSAQTYQATNPLAVFGELPSSSRTFSNPNNNI